MQNKQTFVLYVKYFDTLKDLNDAALGILFRAILVYQKTGQEIDLPVDIKIAFAFIKTQLDIDNQKYEDVLEKRSNAGKIGMEKRWKKQQKNIDKQEKNNKHIKDNKCYQNITKITNITDSDGVVVSVSDGVSVKDKDLTTNDSCSDQQVGHEPNDIQEMMEEDEIVEEEIQTSVPEELQKLVLYANDQKLIALWPTLVTSWKESYPGVDIAGETAKAHSWEVSNPKKRKVDRARFLNNWFAKEQDSCGGKIFGGRIKENKSTEYNFEGKK